MASQPPAKPRPSRSDRRHQVASLVRTAGTALAQTCESPEYRLIVTGISGLIATAITWRDRRSM